MRSDLLGGHPKLRRLLPWALWGLAACIAVPMAISQAGIGSSPALIETREAVLAPIRTEHRLRIGKILVQPGQRVRAGDLLVQMDTAEIDAELAVAHAKLEYAEIVANWRQLRVRDERARTAHALATTAEHAAIESARIVTVAEHDRSELAQLDTNLALEETLVGERLASAERLKAMRLHHAALLKKVEAFKAAVAQARRSSMGAAERLGAWRQGAGGAAGGVADGARASGAASRTGPGIEDDARTAAGEVQRREIARLDVLRRQHEIRAPFDGRVAQIFAHEGELSPDPAIPIITVAEEESRTAVAYLTQSKANRVRPGDLVKLIPRDLSGPAHTGRVTGLSPGLTELPERFQRVPRLREYGRNAYIRLDTPASLPGLACDAVFRHESRGGK
jgi:multidrug resistance efflux pump